MGVLSFILLALSVLFARNADVLGWLWMGGVGVVSISVVLGEWIYDSRRTLAILLRLGAYSTLLVLLLILTFSLT